MRRSCSASCAKPCDATEVLTRGETLAAREKVQSLMPGPFEFASGGDEESAGFGVLSSSSLGGLSDGVASGFGCFCFFKGVGAGGGGSSLSPFALTLSTWRSRGEGPGVVFFALSLSPSFLSPTLPFSARWIWLASPRLPRDGAGEAT